MFEILRSTTTIDFDQSKIRYQCSQGCKDKDNKTVIKYTLVCLQELKSFMISVNCFYIGGILYIVISNKLISKIIFHTNTFLILTILIMFVLSESIFVIIIFNEIS